MKTSIASVLALLFASQAAHSQDPQPSPNPVEEQEDGLPVVACNIAKPEQRAPGP